jgi:hypothetical protein
VIDKFLAALAIFTGVSGYYFATVTSRVLILTLSLVADALGAALAVVGARVVKHHAPDLAAVLIHFGWRATLFVVNALAGTVVGLAAKLAFPDPTISAVASIFAGGGLALTALASGVVERYSAAWFAYRFLAPYRDRWPSLPSPGQDKGRAAWHRANALPPADFEGDNWTLEETQATLQAFKDAIEAQETTG